MRPTIALCLLALCLLGMGLRHSPAARPQGRLNPPAAPPPPLVPPRFNPPVAPPAVVPAQPVLAFVVEGEWCDTQEKAVQSALETAQGKVVESLRHQSPPMECTPDTNFIRDYIVKNVNPEDEFKTPAGGELNEVRVGIHKVREEAKTFQGLGQMYRVCLRMGVGTGEMNEIRKLETDYQNHQFEVRAGQRQTGLAKVLAIVVALLAAVAGYLRLEDATKGYYTTLLRLAMVGVLILLVGASFLVMN